MVRGRQDGRRDEPDVRRRRRSFGRAAGVDPATGGQASPARRKVGGVEGMPRVAADGQEGKAVDAFRSFVGDGDGVVSNVDVGFVGNFSAFHNGENSNLLKMRSPQIL